MTTGNSEHVAKGSLDPEDPTKYSTDNPTENSVNHEETPLSRVGSSLADQAIRDSERGVQQTPEEKKTRILSLNCLRFWKEEETLAIS